MKKLLFAAASIFVAVTAFAQVNPNAPLQRDPAILYGKLDNGMTYYIMHNDTQKERAEYYLFTNVGAIQETPAQDGLAHFLEHMCFNGTKNFPGKGIINYMESIGASFGANINASTGVEQTMYMFNNIPTTREGMIDSTILAIHDYAAFVNNDPAEIDLERGVIIEEWRTRRNSQWRTMEKMFTYLFKDSKYATCNVIGTKEGLETFPAEELQKFYKTWYRPDLQAIVIVGDIEPGSILEKVKKTFADIPAAVNPEPKAVIKVPDNDLPIVGIITDPEAQTSTFAIYFKSEPLPMQYRSFGAGLMIDIIQDVVDGMFNERLSDIAAGADAPFMMAMGGWDNVITTMDAFAVQAVFPDGDWKRAADAVVTEIEKARRYGFTQQEFDRVKADLIASAERASANASKRKNAEIINKLNNDFFNGWPAMAPSYYEEQLKGYLGMITVDQVNQIMAAQDFSKNMVVLYTAPERDGLTHPSEEDITNAISAAFAAEIENNAEEEELGELLDASLLKGSKVGKTSKGPYGSTVWKLKNGVRVTMRPSDYKKEEIRVNISVPGGTSLIADDEMASLDDNMVAIYNSLSGLGDIPRTKLNKMLTGKIVSTSVSFSDIAGNLTASSTPKDFETLLQLIYLTLQNPRFDKDEMASGFTQINAIVPNMEKQPDFIMYQEFSKIAYGNSPRKELISSDKIGRITLESFERSYRQIFSNFNGTDVVITGNFDPEAIKPLVEKYIGSLPGARKSAALGTIGVDVVPGKIEKTLPVAMTTPKTSCILVASGNGKSGVEERYISQAVKGVLDMVYVKTLREEEGGTYGARVQCAIQSLPTSSHEITVSFDTDPERAAMLFELAEAGLRELAQAGPDAEQLAKVKENMLKKLPEQRINNAYWAGRIQTLYNTGVDMDTDAEAVINGITAEKVRKYVADLLAQGNLLKFVMVPAE